MQDIHGLLNGGRPMYGDRRMRAAAAHHQQQALNCPRCDSLNTKFCYYNNYNLSQPRHFCKNCRRYWTKGGVLRNVPVGGGCRKSKRASKRKNSSSPPPAALKSSSGSSGETTSTARAHSGDAVGVAAMVGKPGAGGVAAAAADVVNVNLVAESGPGLFTDVGGGLLGGGGVMGVSALRMHEQNLRMSEDDWGTGMLDHVDLAGGDWHGGGGFYGLTSGGWNQSSANQYNGGIIDDCHLYLPP